MPGDLLEGDALWGPTIEQTLVSMQVTGRTNVFSRSWLARPNFGFKLLGQRLRDALLGLPEKQVVDVSVAMRSGVEDLPCYVVYLHSPAECLGP